MRFVCDDNLGRLARWLRTLGFDTAFDSAITDQEVLGLSLSEERVILTRDHALAEQALARQCLLIDSDQPLQQLKEVIDAFSLKIDPNALLTRCPDCNQPVTEIRKEDYADEIPPYVLRTQDQFSRCASCKRIFWEGTHVQHMKKQLAEIGLVL